MKLRRLLLLVVLIVGCATTGKFSQQMDSWLGGDVNQAIMRFGMPSNSFTLPNGSKMYSWLWVGGTVVTANYNQYLNMATAGAVTYWCEMSMTAAPTGQDSSLASEWKRVQSPLARSLYSDLSRSLTA